MTRLGVRKTGVNGGISELLHITTCPQENDSIQQQTATRLPGFRFLNPINCRLLAPYKFVSPASCSPLTEQHSHISTNCYQCKKHDNIVAMNKYAAERFEDFYNE